MKIILKKKKKMKIKLFIFVILPLFFYNIPFAGTNIYRHESAFINKSDFQLNQD